MPGNFFDFRIRVTFDVARSEPTHEEQDVSESDGDHWRFTVLDGTRLPNGGTVLSFEIHLGPSRIERLGDECQLRLFDPKGAEQANPDYTSSSGLGYIWRDAAHDHLREVLEPTVERADAEFADLMLDATAYGPEHVEGRVIDVAVTP